MPFDTDKRVELEGWNNDGGEEVSGGGAEEREGQRGRARPPRGPHGKALMSLRLSSGVLVSYVMRWCCNKLITYHLRRLFSRQDSR